jgi:membrane fusion protein (multidrug efflux system)
MKLDNTHGKCSRELDHPYPAVGFLYDLQACDYSQPGGSAAGADFRRPFGCLNRPETSRIKRRLLVIAAMLAPLSALVFGGSYLWNYLQSYESTEDARIVAQTTLVTARISGTITGRYVEPYQQVRGGQPLLQLDPRDQEIAVQQARAQLSRAETDVDVSRQQYAFVRAKIREAQVRDLEGRREQQRYLTLLRMGVVSRVEYDQRNANAGVLGADVKTDQAEATLALRNIAFRLAQVHRAKAGLDQAILKLGYTRIVAPADGIIGLRTGELGQRVEPGESLMVLSRPDDLWVRANFKEAQLARIRREQAVAIHVDAIGRDFRGHIQGMPGMTGSLYSLLPHETYEESYVTNAERIPVPIVFDPGQDLSRLRPGMSVEPTVWLK